MPRHSYDSNFEKHAKQGAFPNYVVVEQRYFDLKKFPANDNQPSHDVSEGQKLVKVYETLQASPKWNEMLIITYDEHGGFYNHVPTPVRNLPNPHGLHIPSGSSYFRNLKHVLADIHRKTFLTKDYTYKTQRSEGGTIAYRLGSCTISIAAIVCSDCLKFRVDNIWCFCGSPVIGILNMPNDCSVQFQDIDF